MVMHYKFPKNGPKSLKEPEGPELELKLHNTSNISSELFSSYHDEIPIFNSKEKEPQNTYLSIIPMSINLDYFPEINILYFLLEDLLLCLIWIYLYLTNR